jgi:hypothetical protein
VAVLLAIGGTAFASGYIITSVKQIKPSVRKTLKGRRGPPGLQGPAGQPGALNATVVRGERVSMCADTGTFQPCQVAASIADCPAGNVALAGGWDGLDNPPLDATVAYNYGAGGSWGVIMVNHLSLPASFQTVATCAPGGASARLARRTAADRVRREKARVISEESRGLTP